MARAIDHLRAEAGDPVAVAATAGVLSDAVKLLRTTPLASHIPVEDSPRNLTGDHLRAQRFARVRVAEMALYHGAQVKAGREGRDLYGILRESVEEARQGFRDQFLTEPRGIPDYLHQELVL